MIWHTEEMGVDQYRNVDVQKIAAEGARIYEQIKGRYESDHKGEFLAINIDTGEEFLGSTNSEAVEKAREKYPETIFYVVRIGYSATETLAAMTRA
ncbi:MAG: hypothetical protein WEC84_03595 [Candidatus Andersenbacteria bacterium]